MPVLTTTKPTHADKSKNLGFFLSPAQIAEKMGHLVSLTRENDLSNYTHAEFRRWGLSPLPCTSNDKKSFLIAKPDKALYPDHLMARKIINGFFNSKDDEDPSKTWLDAASIAINLGFPGHWGRSALNKYVVEELAKLNLCPSLGRHGVRDLAQGINARDGGIYPKNNLIVVEIIQDFFQQDLLFGKASNEDLKYALKIGA